MSIWEDIAKGASDAASFAVKKTGEVTSLAKMKLALHTEETKLSECYRDMGKLYYISRRDDREPGEEMEKLISDADTVAERIAAIKLEIADLQDSVICSSCKAKINRDFEFCPICGAKQKGE